MEEIAARRETFQQEIWEILAQSADIAANGDSSISAERARELYASICYTISLAPKLDLPAKELYEIGRRELRQRIAAGKALYEYVKTTMLPLENRAYWDTFRNIGVFFDAYQSALYAHDIPCTMDYPLSRAPVDLRGIDYIHAYLHRLAEENEFCRRFPIQSIRFLLARYTPEPDAQILNLFLPVAETALCMNLLRIDPKSLRLSPEQRNALRNRIVSLGRQGTEDALLESVGSSDCLYDAAKQLAPRVWVGAVYDTLTNVLP